MPTKRKKPATQTRPTRSKHTYNWLAEMLRFSAFHISSEAQSRLFETIAGNPPVQIIEQPAQSILQEIGLYGERRLIVSRQGNRTDIILAMNEGSGNAPPSLIAQIGPLHDALRSFLILIQKFLVSAPEMKRMALGVTMLISTASVLSANELLLQLVPSIKFEPSSVRDVFWQVNRPRQSINLNTFLETPHWRH